jgi:hypothetical protein
MLPVTRAVHPSSTSHAAEASSRPVQATPCAPDVVVCVAMGFDGPTLAALMELPAVSCALKTK